MQNVVHSPARIPAARWRSWHTSSRQSFVCVCIWAFPMYAKQMLMNQPLHEKLAVPPGNPKTQNPDSKTEKTHPKTNTPIQRTLTHTPHSGRENVVPIACYSNILTYSNAFQCVHTSARSVTVSNVTVIGGGCPVWTFSFSAWLHKST